MKSNMIYEVALIVYENAEELDVISAYEIKP